MAYAGLPPAIFTNNLTNVQLIDDISGSFNGSTQTFALTSNSAPFHAVSARSLIVVLGGIVQKPQVDYTVDGANITFIVAPVSGLTFGARNIYGLNYLDNVNDGVITPAKLSTGGPSWNTSGTVTVSGDLNVVGSFNSGTQGLFWQDNEPANFGNDNDLQIYHNGVDSYIRDLGTGNLNIYGDNEITIRNGQGSEYKARFISDGAVELYHNGTKKFETNSDGILVSGTARVPNATAFTSSDSGGTERWLMYMSGGVSPSSGDKLFVGNPLNDDVILFSNNTERLRVTGSGNIGIGTTNPTTKLDVFVTGGEGLPSVVTGERMRVISNDVVSRSGFLSIIAGSSAYSGVFFGDKDAADIGKIRYYHADNSLQFLVNGTTEGLRISSTGNVGISTTNPSSKLHVYNGDLELTGGYNLTWGGTFSGGNPTIWGNASNKTIRFAPDGNTTGLVALLGASSSYILGNVGIGTTNPGTKLHVYQASGDGVVRLTTAFGSGTEYDLTVGGNGNYSPGVFAIRYNTGGTTPFIIEPTGHVTPGADATQNLGSSTKRWANIYSADLQLSNEGSSNDVDGTWGQYTIQEGEDDLFLLNRRNGKKYKFVLQEVN